VDARKHEHERSGHSRSLSFPSVCVFRLTNVIPKRIIFVSRGITVVWWQCMERKTVDTNRWRGEKIQI